MTKKTLALVVFCVAFAFEFFCLLPATSIGWAAGTIVIPAGGDFIIDNDGTYQMADGYSGRITISHNASSVTIVGSTNGLENANTAIMAEGVRSTALWLTIQDLKIKSTGGSALDLASAGSHEHKLFIKGACYLTSTGGMPGAAIRIPAGIHLTIDKTPGLTDAQANLTAKGGFKSAAIGGSDHEGCGTLLIKGSTIKAIAGDTSVAQSAGIGGGYYGSGGFITIDGGVVEADGDYNSAGIGGGFYGDGGVVTINGGNVTATGYAYNGNDGVRASAVAIRAAAA